MLAETDRQSSGLFYAKLPGILLKTTFFSDTIKGLPQIYIRPSYLAVFIYNLEMRRVFIKIQKIKYKVRSNEDLTD